MPLFGGDNGERTAADREAARQERERRRAEREGRTPAPAPDAERPADAEPPADVSPFGEEPPAERDAFGAEHDPFGAEPPAPEPPAREPRSSDARWSAEPRPSAPEPEPVFEPFADEPAPEPVASHRERPATNGADDPQATQPLEPIAARPGRRTVSLPHPQTEEEDGHHTDSWDRPIGTVRRSRAGYQAQPGAPGMPPHRSIGVRKRGRRWMRRFAALLAIALVAAIAVFFVLLYQPFHGKGSGAVVVRIPSGAGARDIGDLLAKQDVVDSGFFFALRARLSGDREKLRAGTYTLKRSMSYGDALTVLTATPAAAPTIDVTLPEGPSRKELAARVKAAGVRGSYVAASERSSLLSPRHYGAPKGTRGLEGFLFPDTYQLRSRDATSKALVADQLKTFKREFAKVDLKRAKARNLSRYDVLIIASMIEREALVPKDRRLISAVIYNRLRRGMPLGIDATLRYRLNNWSRPLKQSELNTSSAYNTRKVEGLPPTPIGNPGLASLQAAADPAKVSYLFYVVKPCGNGAHAFSSTDAKFQQDVAAYNKARAKRGGKDPSKC
jgi:uncharacterized YceG family protein